MIIFFYGENDFRSTQKIKDLKEKFLKEVDKTGNSLHILDGKDISIGEINEKIGAQSLLSSKSMIIIEDIFLNKKKEFLPDLLEFLKSKIDTDNIIVFKEDNLKVNKKGVIVKIDAGGKEKALLKKEKDFVKFLKEQKFIQEFKKFSGIETVNWIKKVVEERDGMITPSAAQSLANLSNNNLWQIDKEINKLINHRKGKVSLNKEESIAIEVSEVENLVKGNFDENIFALTDAIGAKNKTMAIKLLEDQYLAGASDVYLLLMMTRQIKILLQISSALENNLSSREIASILRLHPFVVQKGITQSRNFTLKRLKEIFNKLVEIDYNMKTGKLEIRLALSLFISKL